MGIVELEVYKGQLHKLQRLFLDFSVLIKRLSPHFEGDTLAKGNITKLIEEVKNFLLIRRAILRLSAGELSGHELELVNHFVGISSIISRINDFIIYHRQNALYWRISEVRDLAAINKNIVKEWNSIISVLEDFLEKIYWSVKKDGVLLMYSQNGVKGIKLNN